MRRHRQKSTTLAKTMLVAVLITIGILPILAYLGYFEAGKQAHYLDSTLINLPPPPPVAKARPRTRTVVRPHSHSTVAIGQKAAPLPLHVAAAAGGAPDTDDGVQNGTNTNIGKIPAASPAPAVAPPSIPAPVSPPPIVAPPAPVAPPPVVAAPPHIAVISPAQVVANPQPALPDDMRASDLSATFRALFTIHPDGTADVKMIDSTGNSELDQLALDAAKQWRFRPATKDGTPIESYLRLDVEFDVS
jgi:protein TonB